MDHVFVYLCHAYARLTNQMYVLYYSLPHETRLVNLGETISLKK